MPFITRVAQIMWNRQLIPMLSKSHCYTSRAQTSCIMEVRKDLYGPNLQLWCLTASLIRPAQSFRDWVDRGNFFNLPPHRPRETTYTQTYILRDDGRGVSLYSSYFMKVLPFCAPVRHRRTLRGCFCELQLPFLVLHGVVASRLDSTRLSVDRTSVSKRVCYVCCNARTVSSLACS